MIKHCPIMSGREKSYSEKVCIEKECAFWDEEREQCCIKSAALAVAGKTSDDSSPTAQAYYIPPSSYCQTNAVSDTKVHFKPPAIDTSYITF